MKNKIEKAAGILRLAANDFKAKYAGSALGTLWAVAEPLVTVFVYWFVYTVALGQGGFEGVPYYLWLSAGLAPWFFISNGIQGVTSAFRDYSFLVKKMRFNTKVLPAVRTLSAFISHIIFLCIVFVMCTLNKTSFSRFFVLIPMLFCTAFVYTAGRISALLCTQFKDTQNIVSVLLNIGFWLTPVFWNGENVSGAAALWLRLNPAAVITNGYRAAMLTGEAMSIQDVAYLSVVCLMLGIVGAVYQKAVISTIADKL